MFWEGRIQGSDPLDKDFSTLKMLLGLSVMTSPQAAIEIDPLIDKDENFFTDIIPLSDSPSLDVSKPSLDNYLPIPEVADAPIIRIPCTKKIITGQAKDCYTDADKFDRRKEFVSLDDSVTFIISDLDFLSLRSIPPRSSMFSQRKLMGCSAQEYVKENEVDSYIKLVNEGVKLHWAHGMAVSLSGESLHCPDNLFVATESCNREMLLFERAIKKFLEKHQEARFQIEVVFKLAKDLDGQPIKHIVDGDVMYRIKRTDIDTSEQPVVVVHFDPRREKYRKGYGPKISDYLERKLLFTATSSSENFLENRLKV